MPYTRTYSTVIPIEPGDDLEVLRWLTRESFERKAADDALVIIDYTETPVDPDELPPKAAKQLGRPLTDFEWHRFSAVCQRA